MNWSLLLKSAFWLFVPVLIWNAVLYTALPPNFEPDVLDRGVPLPILWTEHFLRILVFALPIFYQIELKRSRQKWGLFFYLVGLCLYFGSWLLQIYAPQSSWSLSGWGYTALAYTIVIWLLGVFLMVEKSHWLGPWLWWSYLPILFLFVLVHTLHSYLAFLQH